ncbi:glycosyl transferase family 35 [Clostridia bacterium]|nr:glycosyl transferase family 35 [Clostridia bacterium]
MQKNVIDKEHFKQGVKDCVKQLYRKTIEEASPQEIYQAVAHIVEEHVVDRWIATQKTINEKNAKIVYYMSMEFLMGRALGNNLINLCAYEEIKEALDELGLDLNALEDEEPDPALGNGGLGRLAACFMESLATLGYPAYGCGIRYRYGMFKQKIEDGFQLEAPDNWLKNGYPFELRRHEYSYEVKFGGYVRADKKDGETRFVQEGHQSVTAVPYDMPIIGYNNNVVNSLMIWDAEAVEVFGLEAFEKGNYQLAVEQDNLAKNLVEVLYPADNHVQGKELRLKQQYFFVSASLQRIIARFKKYNTKLSKLPDKVAIQMNDTHPTVAVAELMRILMDEEHLDWDDAWEITTKTCAYTNHTIMSEALEKWPVDIFKRLLPRIYQIVEEINRRFLLAIEVKFPGDQEKAKRMAILADNQVKMAHLAIAAGHSVNGVARLHTEILKERELHDFYKMYPKKFNNKTNGITQRRFLCHGNPLLASWVTKHIGDGWITDLSQMKKLEPLAEDAKEQKAFMEIKRQNKLRLAKYIKENNGIDVDPDSIFDVQIKRLHEYKRQLLNILHVMHLYNQLKENPSLKIYPRTFIFGAKAAASYRIAKLTIKLINAVAQVVNNDATIGGQLKVVFIEDYKVSNAEIIFAASDVSEQISTASKEASGTGNMKFMLNGAVTIGTMDGANVEIVEEVGVENAVIFGLSSDEVIQLEKTRSYDPVQIFNEDKDLAQVIAQLINGFYSPSNPELFRPLYNSLLNKLDTQYADTYFVLKDFHSYVAAQKKIEEAYADKDKWAKMAILNVARSGKFTSDRTIEEYVEDIWELDKIKVSLPE